MQLLWCYREIGFKRLRHVYFLCLCPPALLLMRGVIVDVLQRPGPTVAPDPAINAQAAHQGKLTIYSFFENSFNLFL